MLDILKEWKEILVIVVPAIYATGYAIWKRIQIKKIEIDKKSIECRVAMFNRWEHEESCNINSKIRSRCNYFKDQGDADLVSYFQLENGTIATSRLHNMFITCLVEDDRFGRLPKAITKMQRIPYSQVAVWIDTVRQHVYGLPNGIEDVESVSFGEILKEKGVRSALYEEVRDGHGYFIGVCSFEYAEAKYNNEDVQSQKEDLHDFKTSVQSIFIEFHMLQEEKLKELKITIEDVNKYRRR